MRVFLTQQRLQDRDPAFQDARRQILAQILPSETDKRNACENLKIIVGIRSSSSTPPLELVRVLEASSAAVAAQNPDKDSPPYPFVAGSFDLSVRKVSAFTRETARRIEAWQARRVSPLYDKVWISNDNQWSAIRFGEMISDVFKPNPESEEVASSGSIYATITDDFSAQRFAQICSALLHTQHVRSLKFLFHQRESGTIEDRRLRRRWLMFALFSRWSTHSIKDVRLGCVMNIGVDDFEDLRLFLMSKNPLPLLFSDDESAGSSDAQPRQVKVSRDSVVKLEIPRSWRVEEEEDQDPVALPQETWLDVIEEDPQQEGSLLVLVPAYGQCRLRRADVIEERSLDQNAWSFGSHGIRSLGLDFSFTRDGETLGLSAFLQCFGRQIEVLNIRWVPQSVVETFVAALAACPSVKRLYLTRPDPTVLQRLVHAYEIGVCKATSFEIDYLHEHRISPPSRRFYEALADPSERIARTLRELSFSNESVNEPTEEVEIALIRKMLASNTVLEYFERQSKPDLSPAYTEVCREFDHGIIATVTPLSPRAKCAFLSVLSSPDNFSSLAMTQLDSTILANIFAMAAIPVKRRVVSGSFRTMEVNW